MTPKILIIDDDKLVATSLQKALKRLSYDVDICLQAEEVFDVIEETIPDIILLDIYLETANGLTILSKIKKKYHDITVIMITGYADVKIAVQAIKHGAYDFLLKPIDLEQLKFVLDKAVEVMALKTEVNKLQSILESDQLTRDYFGKSKKIKSVLKSVEKLAKSADTTILLTGESGTGKEILAKYIHQNSPRKDEPFIQINCAAIPKELAESELFGHEKGAFTGAGNKTKLGKFELANNGTILLDEIGELPLDIQVKLLRVLQERKIYRVGGEKEISLSVRVLAATNKDLEKEIENGNFREDLYYRLNVANVQLPPLRERKEDIPILALKFLSEFSQKLDKTITSIDSETISYLKSYTWKGNVRELRNVMERVALFIGDEEEEVKEHHLDIAGDILESKDDNSESFVLKIPSKGIPIDVVLKKLIEETLRISKGNQVKAAKILGLSRSKLRYRMDQLGIKIKKSI